MRSRFSRIANMTLDWVLNVLAVLFLLLLLGIILYAEWDRLQHKNGPGLHRVQSTQ